MTIGLAWDWWKERPQKAAAKAVEQARAETQAEAQKELREQQAELRERNAQLREMLLRNGIDPDTGEPLPLFNRGGNPANGPTDK